MANMESNLLAVLLLGGYSIAITSFIYYGSHFILKKCCNIKLIFKFWPLAIASLIFFAFISANLSVPQIFFAAGIGLIILQFMGVIMISFTYVLLDLIYYFWTKNIPIEELPCNAFDTRGCVIRKEREIANQKK